MRCGGPPADLSEANRLKDEFLATLSHELRTPLSVILGWATALERPGGGVDVSAARTAILRNAMLLTQPVGDLLDVSRIVTGKLRLDGGVQEAPGRYVEMLSRDGDPRMSGNNGELTGTPQVLLPNRRSCLPCLTRGRQPPRFRRKG